MFWSFEIRGIKPACASAGEVIVTRWRLLLGAPGRRRAAGSLRSRAMDCSNAILRASR
jgi:hypothetical protein